AMFFWLLGVVFGGSAMFYWLLGAYVFFFFVTFGHFYRMHQAMGSRVKLKHIAASIVWPVYWSVHVGITNTARIMRGSFEAAGDAAMLASLFFGGFYLSTHWQSCDGLYGCASVVAKAGLSALLWPVYAGYLAGSS